MRPKSIILFERVFLASILFTAIDAYLSFDDTLAQMQRDSAVVALGWGAGVLMVAAVLMPAIAHSKSSWLSRSIKSRIGGGSDSGSAAAMSGTALASSNASRGINRPIPMPSIRLAAKPTTATRGTHFT